MGRGQKKSRTLKVVTIVLTKQAEKSFLKLPESGQKKISKAIDKLIQNPLGGEKLKGELIGQYKIYAWPYRVIYIFSAIDSVITVVEIEYRQGAYK